MAYGLTLYRPPTTAFDSAIAAKNAANPSYAAANLAAQDADNANILASRGQVLEAFQALSTAPILPSEALIRQWMISGLGYKKQTFTNAQNSLYNSSSAYAATIVADRQFQADLIAPLTITQADNQNGNPSQSTQDQFNNNKTSFLLGADNGKDYVEMVNSLTVSGISTPQRDTRFYNGATFDGSCWIYIASNSNLNNSLEHSYSDFSLEMWIQPSRSGRMSLFGRQKYDPNPESYYAVHTTGHDLYINSSNKLVWELPPFKAITSPQEIPANQWTHIYIAYQSVPDTRYMYINGVKVAERYAKVNTNPTGTAVWTPIQPRTKYINSGAITETDFGETQATYISSFASSSTYFSGGNWSNALGLTSTRGWSIGDRVKIYGYLPYLESYSGRDTIGYIYDISATANLVQIEGGISLNGSGTTGSMASKAGTPLLVRVGMEADSASYRGVVATSSSYPTRLYLDPVKRAYRSSTNPVTNYGYSGVAEYSWITSAPINSYQPGEKIMFTGVSRGGVVLNKIYYITSVVAGDNIAFGGYITISTINSGYSAGQDVSFSYFTDNGSTLQMFINKLPTSYDLGWYPVGNQKRTVIGKSDSLEQIDGGTTITPPFEGTTGGLRMVISDAAYKSSTSSLPSTFTPESELSSWTGGGSTPLLIVKNNGTVPINTSNTALSLQYQNTNNIVVYGRPKYLGSVAYNGTSSYSTVSGGTFIIPSGTDWCAEAWIFPNKLKGGIIGSGATGTNYWAITLGTDGKVNFASEGFSVNSGTTVLTVKTWNHVAVSLNGNTFRLFVNGTAVSTTTISPVYFRPNSSDSKYYIGRHVSDYFSGYIAAPRLVVGKAIYTTTFTPSTSKPLAPRTWILNAYAANRNGPVIPEEGDIQYWMVRGFDTFITPFFTSTDVTWNQVDSFYVTGNTTVTKTYSVCVGKEILVTQVLIGTPDIRQAYYSNVITTNSTNGTVNITGATVDALITVFMR